MALTPSDLKEIEKRLGSISSKLCELIDATGGGDQTVLLEAILEAIQDQPQKEIIEIPFCEDGLVTGYVIKVYDEESETFTEVFLDNTAQVTTVRPSGSVCSAPEDIEFKFFETEKCLADGSKIKEVLCQIYEDKTLDTESTFWIVNGSSTNINPGVVDCIEPCNPLVESFQGNNPTLSEFNNITAIVPSCCEVTITTSAGTITIPAQNSRFTFNQSYDCLVSNYMLSGDCIDDITTILQKSK